MPLLCIRKLREYQLRDDDFTQGNVNHSCCRSLLQKSIRRGDWELADKIISHLSDAGEGRWVKKRSGVIIFEECWPLGVKLTGPDKYISTLKIASKAVKNKDAAGLGALGLALSKGDYSVLDGRSDDRHIKVVAEAIRRPHDFWRWAYGCSDNEILPIVDNAHMFYKQGGWPWDLAFMQAAAYLAITFGMPPVKLTSRIMPTPYWVGIDKHTAKGKSVLSNVATTIGCSCSLLSTVSFYLESAICNESTESSWWKREKTWNLGRYGLNSNTADKIWAKARPLCMKLLEGNSEKLIGHINTNFQGVLKL